MKKIKKIVLKIESVMDLIIAVTSFLALLFCVYSVTGRLIGFPSAWSDELLKAVFIWIFYMAVPFACREDKLIGITMLEESMSRRSAGGYKTIKVVQNIFTLGFAGFLSFYGVVIAMTQLKKGELTAVLQFPAGLITLGFAIGCVLWTLICVYKIADIIVNKSVEVSSSYDEAMEALKKFSE